MMKFLSGYPFQYSSVKLNFRKVTFVIMLLPLLLFSEAFPQNFEANKNLKKNFIQLSGRLFNDVQLSGVFKDSKTFVDVIPIKDPDDIKMLYDSVKNLPDFDLSQFVMANFRIPSEATDPPDITAAAGMDEHIENLWEHLIRNPEEKNSASTLIPLKYPYIVPGGRFREIYYWDSFFTILGLLADDKVDVAENMVLNFSYLLKNFKMIPNGNRIYYLTRSQPPFFSLMVDVICRHKNDYSWGLQFLKHLETEYQFWMNGMDEIRNDEDASERVIIVKPPRFKKTSGVSGVLNRYYDFDTIPREESYKEDYNLSLKISEESRADFSRNLRAAAESGWDFSSRWFADEKSLSSIITTDILPVDLNCLLYFLEDRLSFFYKLNDETEKSDQYRNKASARSKLINELFWNEEKKFYFDYNWQTGAHTEVYTLAGVFPLYFGIAKPEYASAVSEKVKDIFLKPGGLLTTINETVQQWDAPNGWPPLQWMTIKGLREYGIDSLADVIKERWLSLNENVFKRTGRMLEKYNVINIELFAGGGEYPLQDGFGWTNGVAGALISDFDKKFLLKNLK